MEEPIKKVYVLLPLSTESVEVISCYIAELSNSQEMQPEGKLISTDTNSPQFWKKVKEVVHVGGIADIVLTMKRKSTRCREAERRRQLRLGDTERCLLLGQSGAAAAGVRALSSPPFSFSEG